MDVCHILCNSWCRYHIVAYLFQLFHQDGNGSLITKSPDLALWPVHFVLGCYMVEIHQLLKKIFSDLSTWAYLQLKLCKRNSHHFVKAHRYLPYRHFGGEYHVYSVDIHHQIELKSSLWIVSSADPDHCHSLCDLRFHQKCGCNVCDCSLACDV